MIRRVFFLLSLIIVGVGVVDAQKVSVIPTPLSIEDIQGEFKLGNKLKWYSNADKQAQKHYQELLTKSLDIKDWNQTSLRKSQIALVLVNQLDSSLIQEEAYELEINKNQIVIKATSEAGLFYGLQSLIQIATDRSNYFSKTLPCVRIHDEPRFGYRGFMLDVSRHFFPKEFVKKQIDALSFFKLNRLHLHLTDAAGWRIEIKKYPRLTEFAAWRTDASWKKWWNGDRKYVEKGSSQGFGGYYTQDDIKEMVAYASKKHITIIPEIEMPGHSEEVLAAYPELSCAGVPYKNSDFCAGNDSVFTFLENVLSEVIELFPSEYIHVGGDEAGKGAWKTCPKCQQRIKENNLKDVDELQSYFMERMNLFLKSKGRKLLGWDEIIQGGLAEGATVMSWRGIEGGIHAVETGHHAVMTPGEFCYFDTYQDAPYTLPEAIGGYLPLEKVYSYDPIISSFTEDQKNLIDGVQANLWTEYVPTTDHVELMIYPRLFALAEVAWTEPARKDWNSFNQKSLQMVELMKKWGYHPFELSQEVGNRVEAKELCEHLARGKKVQYNAPYSSSYIANGDETLTDGIRGGWTYGDKRWQGFISPERLDVIIDLEKVEDIHEISADIMQSPGAEVYLPSQILIEVSEDGENFTTLMNKTFEVEKGSSILIKKYAWEGQASGRFVRFVARSSKDLGGWIFTDEIIIK